MDSTERVYGTRSLLTQLRLDHRHHQLVRRRNTFDAIHDQTYRSSPFGVSQSHWLDDAWYLQIIPRPRSLAYTSPWFTAWQPIMAHLVDCSTCTLNHRCSSLLPYDITKSISVFPTFITQRLYCNSNPEPVFCRLLYFVRPPTILPTILGLSQQTVDSLGVLPHKLDSLGVPSHTHGSLGFSKLPKVIFGIPLQN